ncbi:MAG: diacylglycerol/lipid kinase family protein [Actinomycetes bacterium]
MRVLVVLNPRATSTTPRTREVITAALGSGHEVQTVVTQARGHARDLAARATKSGVGLVVVVGGDGTVNEVVNGLLTDGPAPSVPMMGLVPGGHANVFARALGVPADPVEATGALLEALRDRRTRSVGLGQAADRWFVLNAGIGLDAAAVGAVERRRRAGDRASAGLYVRAAIRAYRRDVDRRHPMVSVARPGVPVIDGLFMAIVANTAPWTFLGRRPVNPTPSASFDTGLDLFGLRRFDPLTTVHHVRQILTRRSSPPAGRDVVSLHDQSVLLLTSAVPLEVQVDGDYLGRREQVTFRSVPHALRVVC